MSNGKRGHVLPVKKTSSVRRAPKKRKTSPKALRSTLDLVREGVRRFILNDASFGEFRRAIRTAARIGKISPNPLTGTAFRRIVKEAIAERNRTTNKPPRS
jgi:DNA-binding NarL/FixJ family response regulator